MPENPPDKSHDVLSDMAKADAEQPGDTPSPDLAETPTKPTEDAPRESN